MRGPSMDEEEQQHLETLLQLYHRSVRRLEEQFAKYGPLEAPLALLNNIEEQKEAISQIEAKLAADHTISTSRAPFEPTGAPERPRVPFMAGALPDNFVQRSSEY